MKRQKPYRLFSSILMLILFQACPTASSEDMYSLMATYYQLTNPSVMMDCNRLQITETSQNEDGLVSITWTGYPQYELQYITITVFHDGHHIAVHTIQKNLSATTIQIDWDNLEGSDTVVLEVLERGLYWDTCKKQTSITRPPVIIVDPLPAMLCTNLALTSPLGGIANGMQTFYWDALENAVSYRINLYYGESLLASWDAAAGQTNLTGDVSSAAIGGESPLLVELLAFDAAGNQCSQQYSMAREAAAPQAAPATSTPTCAEDPSRSGC